jgi:hypothetical protein
VEHHDSTGNKGIIKPGDVQWMTAGRGIVHQEYHSKEFTKSGGNFGKSFSFSLSLFCIRVSLYSLPPSISFNQSFASCG